MTKDPFEYMAGEQQTYTATATCSECGESFEKTSTTSQSAAQGSATGAANACARQDLANKSE